jgi:hypothetical protein
MMRQPERGQESARGPPTENAARRAEHESRFARSSRCHASLAASDFSNGSAKR